MYFVISHQSAAEVCIEFAKSQAILDTFVNLKMNSYLPSITLVVSYVKFLVLNMHRTL